MDDASLASEMVQLLRDELERVRAQIQQLTPERERSHNSSVLATGSAVDSNTYALQSENAQLMREVAAARRSIEQLSGGSTDTNASGLRELEQEGGRGPEAFRLEEEQLNERISRAKEKYKREKTLKKQLEDSLLAAQNDLDETKSQCEQERARLSELQLELGRVVAQHTFDVIDFLRKPLVTPGADPGPAELGADIVASNVPSPANELPQHLSDLCAPGGYLMQGVDEILWASGPSARSRCVSLTPTHHYNPTLNDSKGGWDRLSTVQGQETVKDLFHIEQGQWQYAGTYQYVGRAVVASATIKTFGKGHAEGPQRKTMLFPEMVAPIIVNMVKNMYECGVLKIACTGWRRVGFNARLAEALQPDRPKPQRGMATGHSGGVPIAVPKEGTRMATGNKRLSDDLQDRPRKKHKNNVLSIFPSA